jgi:hypothetical protein
LYDAPFFVGHRPGHVKPIVAEAEEPVHRGIDGRRLALLLRVDAQRQVACWEHVDAAAELAWRDSIDLAVQLRNCAHLGTGDAVATQQVANG